MWCPPKLAAWRAACFMGFVYALLFLDPPVASHYNDLVKVNPDFLGLLMCFRALWCAFSALRPQFSFVCLLLFPRVDNPVAWAACPGEIYLHWGRAGWYT